MTRCTRCVLPDSTPKIKFDENGVCNYCHAYKNYQYKGEAALVKLLDTFRRPNSKYDCMVPVSGGKDSTFTLLKLTKDYGMKVLAVNYDNPYSDPLANKNVEQMANLLNVDLIRVRLKREAHEKSFKQLLNAWMRKPDPALIPVMCSACHLMWYHFIKIARKHDIRLLVSGNDPFEETDFKVKLVSDAVIDDVKQNFTKTIFGVIKKSARNLSYFHPRQLPMMIKGYLFGNHLAIGSRVYGRKIEKIELFSYLPWNEQEILSRITTELDWNANAKYERTWRFDCKVTCVKDYMYMKSLGLTERDDLYAKLVREGIMTREQALQRLEKENKLYPDTVQEVLTEAGINADQFFKVFQAR